MFITMAVKYIMLNMREWTGERVGCERYLKVDSRLKIAPENKGVDRERRKIRTQRYEF
ncbi:hypothetical protein ACFL6G_08835 [candidate division KSB1 bacterium]